MSRPGRSRGRPVPGDQPQPDPPEVDFAAAGLLDGLDDPDARQARGQLLAELHNLGVSLQELNQAVADGRLALLPSERELAGELRYSAHELAHRSGIDLELLTAQRRASGLPSVDPDERAFGDEDLRAADAFKRFLDSGLSPDGLLDSTGVFGQAGARSAAAIRTLLGQSLVRPGDTERDIAQRFAAAARDLHADAILTLTYLFRAHLLHQLRSDLVDRADLATGRVSATHEIAVCFADLVGFTRLGEHAPAEDLGRMADRLGALASDVAEPPVRLVKTIGDAAMLISPDPLPLMNATTHLLDAAASDDELPQLRAGLALGPALHRFGDWYGAPVNLADRITKAARHGSILTTKTIRDVLEPHYRFSRAGKHKLKGLKEPVALYRARPLGNDSVSVSASTRPRARRPSSRRGTRTSATAPTSPSASRTPDRTPATSSRPQCRASTCRPRPRRFALSGCGGSRRSGSRSRSRSAGG